MNGWIEIFRTGKHTDSSGGVREWTEADLDNIARKYDPAVHLAPVVIGHPKDNAPAWAWAAAVKCEGDRLYYTEKDAQPEFDDMRRRGLFRKRSISLYADGTLRHIGWLGAMPPAVKGLADVSFAGDDGAVTIEYDEGWRVNIIGRVLQRLREYFIDEADVETADRIVSQWEIDELKREQEPTALEASPAFHEEKERDMLDALKKQVQELQEKLANFGEQLTAKNGEITSLRTELDKQGAEKRRTDFSTFCNGLVVEGKLTPAQRGKALDFMEILHGAGEYEFAEVGKKSALEEFKAFLGTLPKQVEFSELATRKASGQGLDITDAEAIAKKAREYQESEEKAGRTITISQAVEHVTKGGKK